MVINGREQGHEGCCSKHERENTHDGDDGSEKREEHLLVIREINMSNKQGAHAHSGERNKGGQQHHSVGVPFVTPFGRIESIFGFLPDFSEGHAQGVGEGLEGPFETSEEEHDAEVADAHQVVDQEQADLERVEHADLATVAFVDDVSVPHKPSEPGKFPVWGWLAEELFRHDDVQCVVGNGPSAADRGFKEFSFGCCEDIVWLLVVEEVEVPVVVSEAMKGILCLVCQEVGVEPVAAGGVEHDEVLEVFERNQIALLASSHISIDWRDDEQEMRVLGIKLFESVDFFLGDTPAQEHGAVVDGSFIVCMDVDLHSSSLLWGLGFLGCKERRGTVA